MSKTVRHRRICHVISSLTTGGAERNLFNLLSSHLGKTHEHAVMSLRTEGTFGPRIRDLSIPVFAVGQPLRPSQLRKALKFTRDFQPDMLQGWMYHGNMAAWLLRAALPGRPDLIWNIRHSVYDLGLEKRGTRKFIKAGAWTSSAPEAIIFNAFLSRDQHAALGFDTRRAVVVPNGFDTTLFYPDAERRRQMRAEIDLPDVAFAIGHVGRFHPMKGHAIFLQAVRPVMRERENVHAVLAGRDVTWDNAEMMAAIPEEYRPRIRLLGDRPDVAHVMNGLDLFVQSASSEAFPNVLGEAMASGLACITTDAGDSARVLGDAGWCVPIEDPAAITEIMRDCLAEPEKLIAYGHAARDRIIEHYHIDVTVGGYAALYQTLDGPEGS